MFYFDSNTTQLISNLLHVFLKAYNDRMSFGLAEK